MTFPAGLAALTLATAGAAAAQAQPPSVRIAPARVEATVERGLTMGPLTASNLTGERYSMEVFPVLLGQGRDGGLFVRDDVASRRRAAGLLAVDVRRFSFPPGAARSVLARVRRAPRGEGIYGGILFRAVPRRRPGQIVNILQLNARVLLDPRRSRVRWTAGAVRAEQDGRGRLRFLVAVTNAGNRFARAGGRVTVRDAGGRVLAVRHLKGVEILPGATVDLRARLAAPRLAPGRYRLEAAIRGAGRGVRAGGAMELFGVNQVRTERARLVSFGAPKAYVGHDTEVRASFRNTGNVRFAPLARLEVRPLVRGQPGPVAERVGMEADEADPGDRGELKAEVALDRGSYELRVVLLERGREADARSVGVTPGKRPALTTRLRDFVTENAIAIVLLVLGAVAVAAVFVLRYVRRLQAAARR